MRHGGHSVLPLLHSVYARLLVHSSTSSLAGSVLKNCTTITSKCPQYWHTLGPIQGMNLKTLNGMAYLTFSTNLHLNLNWLCPDYQPFSIFSFLENKFPSGSYDAFPKLLLISNVLFQMPILQMFLFIYFYNFLNFIYVLFYLYYIFILYSFYFYFYFVFFFFFHSLFIYLLIHFFFFFFANGIFENLNFLFFSFKS